MQTKQRMTMGTASCLVSDTLAHAASLLWDNDCGCIPVVDEDHRVQGIITDRDICMAALLTGKRLDELGVDDSMAKDVFGVGPDDSLVSAEMLMRSKGVHRLPVVDAGHKLLGMLCSNDLLRWADDGRSSGAKPTDAVRLVRTLAAIGRPRSSVPATSTDSEAAPQGSPQRVVTHDGGSSGEAVL